MSHIASSEGLVELQGRVAGAYMFEIKKAQTVYMNKDQYSKKERGQAYGAALSTVLNYYI